MVSVEAAIATGSLVAVLALVLAAMSAVIVQVRCVDAAGEAARLASRGDLDGARRAAVGLVPDGSGIVVETHGENVVARVEVPPLGSALPGLRVGASATAAREPDVVAPGEPGTDTVASGDAGADTGASGAPGTDPGASGERGIDTGRDPAPAAVTGPPSSSRAALPARRPP